MNTSFRNSKHTILLFQYNASSNSRTFVDFPSVNAAIDAMIKLYENKLKELNPKLKSIKYEIKDLYDYIDLFTHLNALMYDISFHISFRNYIIIMMM